jgi:tryptophanyl-tRNA synthetase
MSHKKVILTGDRPTGPLHLGHYIGSLKQRLEFQGVHTQYIMIADGQALTDHFATPETIRFNVLQVALDYLAIGIDPNLSTIFIQTLIPEIAELTLFYLNLVTLSRLERNPTVKTEILQKKFGASIPAGFLMYPVHQAADITIVKGELVPVGADQLPMVEQTNELVRTFNRIYQTDILKEAEAYIPKIARLPGIDGVAKMSKSLGNAIYLSDSADVIKQKVMKMYTDPLHLHVGDPGRVEGNTVFAYLDAFDPDLHAVAAFKEQYQQGGLGDVVLKKRLIDVLNVFLEPIREKRKQFESDPDYVMGCLRQGTDIVRTVAQKTMREVRKAMKLDYFK